jgi:hypothetical protein
MFVTQVHAFPGKPVILSPLDKAGNGIPSAISGRFTEWGGVCPWILAANSSVVTPGKWGEGCVSTLL